MSIRLICIRHPMRLPVLGIVLGSVCCEVVVAQEDGDRLYVGTGIAVADYRDRYEAVYYDDTLSTLQTYAGYRFGDRWSLELGYQALSDVEALNIAGSGTDRLDIVEQSKTGIVRALRTLPLSRLLGWRKDITLFGTAGYHVSNVERQVSELNSLDRTIENRDGSGLVLGGGVMFGIKNFALRAYTERLDARGADGTWSRGVTVEFRF